MEWAAGLLMVVFPSASAAERTAPVPGPMASLLAPLPPARSQEWFGAPVLPPVFQSDDPPDDPPWSPDPRPQDPPAAPTPSGHDSPEPSWGKGLTVLDLQAWKMEDDLRLIREWAGDAFLGLPLLLPQLLLEAALPRGVKVGPTTYLYRTEPASSSFVLVVLDQMLFHEAEFLSRAHELSEDRWGGEDLTRGQRRVVRRSLMMGLRASYAVPGMTLGTVVKAAADQGSAGILLVPPLCAAVLFLKGLDQKIDLEDQVHARFKVASGRDWARGAWSDSGVATFSFELKFCDLPVGLLGSFELSRHGMAPSFIGIGTTLDTVEELLGREEARGWRPD